MSDDFKIPEIQSIGTEFKTLDSCHDGTSGIKRLASCPDKGNIVDEIYKVSKQKGVTIRNVKFSA